MLNELRELKGEREAAGMELALVEVRKEAGLVDGVDALPYVDVELLQPGARAQAELMVKEELRRGPKGREVPPVPELNLSRAPLAALELERIEAELPADTEDLAPSLPEMPTGSKATDAEAWRVAIDRAKVFHASNEDHLLNLELLQKYGSSAWLLSNKELEVAAERVRRQADGIESEVADLNKKRKQEQVKVGEELAALQAKYRHLVGKNSRLAAECVRMEADNSGK